MPVVRRKPAPPPRETYSTSPWSKIMHDTVKTYMKQQEKAAANLKKFNRVVSMMKTGRVKVDFNCKTNSP